MEKVIRELKFLWEDHPPEYKEYLKTCEEIQMAPLPVTFPKLARFFRVEGVVLQHLQLRGFYKSRSFQARSDDVFVISFPKTGTTWAQEIVYLIGNNADVKKAKSENMEKRFPLLEYPLIDHDKYDKNTHKNRPQFFKSHLPFSLLPKSIHEQNCKIVYVTRNPKDTLVSMWHFYKMLKPLSYRGSLKDFQQLFINDQVAYAPYPRNVKEFWEHRNDANVLFITFEEMKKDLKSSIQTIAKFLEKTLTEEEIERISNHCSFKKMSSNSKANYSHWKENGMVSKDQNFMRKGEIGDWKNHFDENANKIMDDWIEMHFGNSDVTFTYDY
ncbi:hypothetical protein CHUAL_012954 [Chamberlinius hualienensis]